MKTVLIFLIPYFRSIMHTASVETLPGCLVCLLGQPAMLLFYLAVSDLVTWSQESIFLRVKSQKPFSRVQLAKRKEKTNQPIKLHGGETFARSCFSTVTREMPSIL